MISLRKNLEASQKPLLILVALNLISTLFHYVNYSGVTTAEGLLAAGSSDIHYLGVVLGLFFIITVVWAGYRTADRLSGGAMDGGATGSLISVIAAAVNSIFVLALLYPMAAYILEGTGIKEVNSLVLGFGPVGQGIGIIASVVLGFIFGALGGYFGKAE